MFELLQQLGPYTESMLTIDILHQLSSKYNMHPGCYNATSWEMSEIHCWQDYKFRKIFASTIIYRDFPINI